MLGKIDWSKWGRSTTIPIYKFGIFDRNIKVPTNLLKNYIEGYNKICGDDCGPNGIFRNYLRKRFNIPQEDSVYIYHESFDFEIGKEEFNLYISNQLTNSFKEI